jgi:hypothetical protein
MLKRYKQQQRRQSSALLQSPQLRRPVPTHADSSSSLPPPEMAFSPTYAGYPTADPHSMASGAMMAPSMNNAAPMPAHYAADAANVNYVWSQYESTPVGQQPMWVSDQSLGGNMFTQQGMNAFILPHSEWGPPQHQIW